MRFADVKVGDQVIIDPPDYDPGLRKICQVEKVTATQFTAGGYRFNKRNGWQIGARYAGGATAKDATPELIKQVEFEQRYANARDALRRRMNSLDTLWREIDRNHDCHKWAGALEKALPHLTAAVETLKVRQNGGGAVTLPANIERCRGFGDGPEDWLDECHDCQQQCCWWRGAHGAADDYWVFL